MTRTVLTFGLIAGAILAIMMVATIPFHESIGFEKGEIIGYTSLIMAFLLIFFGIRQYRDQVGGGTVGFGRAFKVGALIALVASLCYVATWEALYYGVIGDEFMIKYQAHVIDKARTDGATQVELDKKAADMAKYAEMYKNPAINAAITLVEPLPLGLVIALVSAGILSRKRKPDDASPVMSQAV